jgi:hypothetical protein
MEANEEQPAQFLPTALYASNGRGPRALHRCADQEGMGMDGRPEKLGISWPQRRILQQTQNSGLRLERKGVGMEPTSTDSTKVVE